MSDGGGIGRGDRVTVTLKKTSESGYEVVQDVMDTEETNSDRENHNKTPTNGEDDKSDKPPQKRWNVDLRYRTADIGPFIVYAEHTALNIGRVHPMKVGGMLKKRPEFNNHIKEVVTVGRNRLKIVLTTATAANDLVSKQIFKEDGLIVYIPQHLTEKKAIVRNVDTKISEIELLEIIESKVPVTNVRRMTRIVENEAGDKVRKARQAIIVTFAGLTVPEHIFINYTRCTTETYIPRVIQCLKCLRYGHTSTQCRGTERCKICGQTHDDHAKCEDNTKQFCIYCKTKDHSSVSKKCAYYEKQSVIKKVMTEKNLSFIEARDLMEKPSYANTIQTSNKFSLLPNLETGVSQPSTSFSSNFSQRFSSKTRPSLGKSSSQPSKTLPHNHPWNPNKRPRVELTSKRESSRPIVNVHATSELEKLKHDLVSRLVEEFKKWITKEGDFSNREFSVDSLEIQSLVEEVFKDNNGQSSQT